MPTIDTPRSRALREELFGLKDKVAKLQGLHALEPRQTYAHEITILKSYIRHVSAKIYKELSR